ncbi:MAG: RNA polymerase sigma factor [Candidatus Wolfebacteria bacterium GW2011_GWC2_39_22]|uniref:RNA polymerase sigma factor n=1 Tax=Candidatus Wolfebacteria bacterium GW2011_GWC2_39_22 TaxID=1619013 RepID=A0A0G0NBK1_9BACT|nr:MAG: RNA polymerase sigma factor [Candidatus Wolfebacteria bacterium GW2011_GWC2_39_22]HBI25476.1 hypothetical protein [Candidatus Wolfebacteria bacterium]
MKRPFYARQLAERFTAIKALYPLGIPVSWISEKLGVSLATVRNDAKQLSPELRESRPHVDVQIFRKVLKSYITHGNIMSTEAHEIQKLLGEWLKIDSIIATFKPLDVLMNNLSYPSHLPEHHGCTLLLRAVFGEKRYPYEGYAVDIWKEYLSNVGTAYTERSDKGRYAGVTIERHVPFPENLDGLEKGFIAYFAEAMHGTIGPMWSKDTPQHIEAVLETLTEREAQILRMRFGIGTGKQGQTLKQIGCVCGVSEERVRQIEAKALRKLRHPSRSGKLKHLIRLEPIYWSPAQSSTPDETVETEQAMLARIAAELESIPIFDRPVGTLEMSVRTANCLKWKGIETIGQLAATPERELLRTQNFGRKSLSELKDVLDALGVTSNVRAGW